MLKVPSICHKYGIVIRTLYTKSVATSTNLQERFSGNSQVQTYLTNTSNVSFLQNHFIGIKANQRQPEWAIDQDGKHVFLVKENEAFEKFYSLQSTCDTEEEWELCLKTMKSDLPQSFRINTSRKETSNHLSQIINAISKGAILPKPWPKEDFPIVWQYANLSRWNLKSEKSYKSLREFLLVERDCGNISRQELVSMIPVFLLGDYFLLEVRLVNRLI